MGAGEPSLSVNTGGPEGGWVHVAWYSRPRVNTCAEPLPLIVAGIIPTASVYAGGGSSSASSQRLGDLNSPTAAHCDAFRVDQGIGFNTLHIAATTCTDGHVEHIQGTPACTIDVSPLNRATPTLCAVIPGSDGSLKIRAEYSISPATLPFITRAVVVQMQVNGDGNGEGEGLVG
jgi:hypothetical protein